MRAEELRPPTHALTLWPEWAHAILHMGKRIENRTWALPSRFVGQEVYLHAGARVSARERHHRWLDVEMMAMMSGVDCPEGAPEIVSGALVGIMRFTGCDAPNTGNLGAWRAPDQYGWKFEFRPLPRPIPCKGALGLWLVSGVAGV